MKNVKHWFRKAPGEEITVCWTEDGVSFVRWARRTGRVRVCRKSLHLEAAAVSARSYRESLAAVSEASDTGNPVVNWLILKETFPLQEAGGGESDKLPVLPEWIMGCWRELDVKEIPVEIVAGIGAMQAELRCWHELKESGSGLCLELGQRVLFLGQGNGTAFHRLSRHGLAAPEGGGFVSREWLLQTRLLFRNSTGAALRRIYMPDGCECTFSWEEEEPFEIIPGVRPPAWCTGLDGGPDPAMLFLHLSLFRGLEDPACRIRLPELDKRRRSSHLERHLRVGACLLLGGWGFLLLGACRHEVLHPAEAGLPKRLESLRQEVITLDQRWRGSREYETFRKKPYRLVGMVAGSAPEAVQVDRIQVEGSAAGDPQRLVVRVEGAFKSEEPTREFREWVELLRRDTPLDTVEHLSFGREDDRILFSLQGITRRGGTD
jgi:hypothetical protein